MRIRRSNLRPASKPIGDLDGWTEPEAKDIEPKDYPWENSKV